MSEDAKPKIYVFCHPVGEPFQEGDVMGKAIAEDGTLLAGHVSSSPEWSERDMTSDHKLEAYARKYPDGYELVQLSPDDLNEWGVPKVLAERAAP